MISTNFLLTSLLVVLMPGTGVIYTLSNGIFLGKKASLAAAMGCTFGIVPSLLASIFGLAAIFHTSALVFQTVKWLGVLFLLYLAISMLKSGDKWQMPEKETASRQQYVVIACKGFLINILNPKLTLFFFAFLPQFIAHNDPQPMQSMIVLGGVFMLLTLIIFMGYGLLATRVRDLFLGSEKIQRRLRWACAGSFLALGAKLALTQRDG